MNSSQLRAKAEELTVQNSQLKSQIEKLKSIEEPLLEIFRRDPSDTYCRFLQEDQTRVTMFCTLIDMYVQALYMAIEEHDQTERQNGTLNNT